MIDCSECKEEYLFCWEINESTIKRGGCDECVRVEETGICDICTYSMNYNG